MAYGAEDCGRDKYAWENFVKIADIASGTTEYSYSVPENLLNTDSVARFFLVDTENLPYSKEVAYVHSAGKAWIDSGIAPRRELIAEFDMRFTADNTEWGTGKSANDTAIYENVFGAFCVDDKRGNFGLCRNRRTSDPNNNKWDRELNGYKNAPSSVQKYQFCGNAVCDEDYHVVFSVTNLIVNGVAFGSGITLGDFIEGGYGIALFRNMKKGSIYDDTMIGYFRNFSLRTPKCLVRNFIPAENSAGDVGMFDTVTGRFFSGEDSEALTAGEELDPQRFGWVRDVTDESFVLGADIPRTAAYTGAGSNPLNFKDPANWKCVNANGEIMENALPSETTQVIVSGETRFSVPHGTDMIKCASIRFDFASPIDAMDLKDLDFSKVTPDSIINLNGKTIYLGGEENRELANLKIQNLGEYKTALVHIIVADGRSVTNTGMIFSGNLEIIKEGNGTLVVAAEGQSYTGGTKILGGVVEIGSSGSELFGSGVVKVEEGCKFDVCGADASALEVLLSGGIITSSSGEKAVFPLKLTLDADSSLRFAQIQEAHDITISSGAVWNLGGKKLSVVLDGTDPDLEVKNVTITNGTFSVFVNTYAGETKGYVQIQALNGADGLILDLGNSMLRNHGTKNSQVFDFTANAPDIANGVFTDVNIRMVVSGTFTPRNPRCLSMKMLGGSTLNLSEWDGVFNCVFSNPKYYNKEVLTDLLFDAGVIHVNLDGRTDLAEIAMSENPYVIVWKTNPPADVSFEIDDSSKKRGFRLRRKEGGVELYIKAGLKVSIR
jgi:autotransporter-associated beta strand protein